MRIELSSIRKRYGKLTALDGIDLEIPAKSRIALIGPNGSGKTTLTRVIMGLVAHEGAVRFDGAPRSAASAAGIAYVPQVAPQMAATVSDLIRTVAGLRGVSTRRISEIGAELGLDVPALADRPFRGLSGGMKQKLLLALGLGTAPRLVILDEPTASLDVEARGRFVELERELLGKSTVILCSHRLDELRALVQRVVVLDDGRVVHDGAAADYVRRHTDSIIEILVDGDPSWLRDRGFEATAGGWWARQVSHVEKMRLVPEAIAALGPRMRDLVVRDHDRLTVAVGEKVAA